MIPKAYRIFAVGVQIPVEGALVAGEGKNGKGGSDKDALGRHFA